MKRTQLKNQIKESLIVIEQQENEVITMGDTCHICGDMSYDDCTACGRPTCKRHGKRVGDHFVCRKCAENA